MCESNWVMLSYFLVDFALYIAKWKFEVLIIAAGDGLLVEMTQAVLKEKIYPIQEFLLKNETRFRSVCNLR